MNQPLPNQPSVAVVEIADFVGLVSDMDPDDIPDGAAQVMVNLTVTRPGEMASRGGLRRLTFDSLT